MKLSTLPMVALPPKHNLTKLSTQGTFIALCIIILWAVSLFSLLTLPLEWQFAPLYIIFALLQTFLYTGLFITAHDAMHNTVCPKLPLANNIIGQISLALYALFSFHSLLQQHKLHHAHPGTDSDPDFHRNEQRTFWQWYSGFLLRYLRVPQLIGMAILFNILHHIANIPLLNLLIFWVAPALLSTIQLFYFGTYLPHRDDTDNFQDEHRAHSNHYPVWLSFITCYHFGYHHEHHLAPYLPWWQLPQLHRRRLSELNRANK